MSSSARVIPCPCVASFIVGISTTGPLAVADAPPAGDSDRPAAPNSGTARTGFMGYLALGLALVRIGRYEEAMSWLRAANEASSGSSPQISWNLAIAYAQVEKVADARRELLEYRKRIGGLLTARWLRYAVGIPVEDYAREVGGPFMVLLRDHVSGAPIQDCR
jgi:hypothetical protein